MAQSHVYAGVARAFGRPEATGAVGLFRRPTDGGNWQHVIRDLEVLTVSVHPDDPSLVFAGTTEGVWRSSDGGASFAPAPCSGERRQVWSLLASDGAPDRMYAGASPIGIYRSDDRGANWRLLPDPGIRARCAGPFKPRVMRMAQRPGHPDEIYAAMEIAGAMRTTDGGETWQDLSDDLVRLSDLPHLRSRIVQDATDAEGMLDCHAIAISPTAPDTPILAVRMGLFQTLDRGKSWQDMQVGRFSPTTYARDIRVSPHDPRTLYAALSVAASSHDGGVYRTTDVGATWSRFDKVQVHGTIMSVCPHPTDPLQVYLAARYDGEIFGTRDGGASWSAMPLPGPVQDTYAIAAG